MDNISQHGILPRDYRSARGQWTADISVMFGRALLALASAIVLSLGLHMALNTGYPQFLVS